MAMATSERDLSRLDDARLVGLAQNGHQEAFAELYNRYFDRIFDFLSRMLRNRAEAEDVAQDTFIRAINAIDRLESGNKFKSWLFTIARNTALNRIEREKRTRPLVFADDEGEDVELDLVDSDRFGSPDEAAQANAAAALVWEAAAGLSPKQYSLLDMHLRQGLDSAEIADVLGVTANNGYVMLNRLRNAVEESIGAYVMMREGRRHCADLDAALTEAGIASISPGARRLVRRHVEGCETCQKTQAEMISPTAILGAFVPIQAGPDVKAAIFSNVMDQWSGSPSSSDGGSSASQLTTRVPQAGARPAVEQAAWHLSRAALAGLLAALAGIALLLVALLNPFGSTSANVPGAAGATVTFQSEDGQPVSGVALIVEYTRPGGQTPTEIPVTTDGDGRIDLSETGPGTYVLRIEQLPPEYQAADLGQVSAFTVAEGEQLDITGVFRVTGR
jgi:RNA polymerase sigma factor (sigma-70 family)